MRGRGDISTCLTAPCPGPSVPLLGEPTWNVTEFETTPVMSTYLLAYIVSEFKHVQTRSPNGVLVRSRAHPSFPRIGPGPRDILVLIHSHLQPLSC